MIPPQIDQLRRRLTDQYVVIEGNLAEWARFRGLVGQVKTINMNGHALVQFQGTADRAWYNIPVEHLRVVEKPAEPAEHPKASSQAGAKPAPTS